MPCMTGDSQLVSFTPSGLISLMGGGLVGRILLQESLVNLDQCGLSNFHCLAVGSFKMRQLGWVYVGEV